MYVVCVHVPVLSADCTGLTFGSISVANLSTVSSDLCGTRRRRLCLNTTANVPAL
jgi:hypothetical protein